MMEFLEEYIIFFALVGHVEIKRVQGEKYALGFSRHDS